MAELAKKRKKNTEEQVMKRLKHKHNNFKNSALFLCVAADGLQQLYQIWSVGKFLQTLAEAELPLLLPNARRQSMEVPPFLYAADAISTSGSEARRGVQKRVALRSPGDEHWVEEGCLCLVECLRTRWMERRLLPEIKRC